MRYALAVSVQVLSSAVTACRREEAKAIGDLAERAEWSDYNSWTAAGSPGRDDVHCAKTLWKY